MLHLRPSLVLGHKWKIRGTHYSHEERLIFLPLKREIIFCGGVSIFTQCKSFRDLKLHFTVAPAANPPKQTPLFCPEPNLTPTKRLLGGAGVTRGLGLFLSTDPEVFSPLQDSASIFPGREESHIPSGRLVSSQAQLLPPHQKQFPRSRRQAWTEA